MQNQRKWENIQKETLKRKKKAKEKKTKIYRSKEENRGREIFLKNYSKQYNKTYLVTCIFILVSIAILHFKDVRTRKNQHLAIFIVSHYNFINWVTLSWWTYHCIWPLILGHDTGVYYLAFPLIMSYLQNYETQREHLQRDSSQFSRLFNHLA